MFLVPASTFCYSAIPWVLVLPSLARVIGRKKTIAFVSFTSIITYIVFCCSTTPLHLLITEILIGVHHATTTTTSIIVLTEYVSPEYRGFFFAIKSASIFWGIWVANTIGTFAHWSNIPKFGLVCTLYTLTVFLWPESPYWLASKNRFVEARKSHRWLKGVGKKSELELEKIISSFADKTEEISPASYSLKFVRTKGFYMPLFLSLVAISQYHFSGKFVITVYALDIMKKIVQNEGDAYKSMLILDGITVLSTYFGCYLTKILKRRTILLSASGTAITFLFIMSLYLYLVKISVIVENIYLSILFLAGFSISISCGPMIMTSTLYGELTPVRYKNISLTIIALMFFTMHGTLLKVAPLIFKALTMPGVFLFYAITSLFCAVLMYVYLPETKDKTLLDIEEYFKEGSKKKFNKLLT